jgi:hypothetical protein
MRGWKRPRRPEPAPPRLQPPDRLETITLPAWGLGLLYWRSLTDQERAWYRDNLTKAPYFNSQKERAI